jgi:hypothetical protein
MRNSSWRFLPRFRIHIILVLVTIAAGWIGWHAYWIRQRHIFLASHPVALVGKHRDTDDAPLFLRLLGEKDVLSLQMNVYSERDWGNEPMDYPEVREAVARARELFPEVQVLDIEPVMRDPR